MSVKVSVTADSDDLNDALQIQRELVAFYQKGFIDGYAKANNIKVIATGRVKREEKLFRRIEGDIKKAFEERFMKKINKKVTEIKEAEANE